MKLTAENIRKLTQEERTALLLRMPENRVQAHQVIFKHRHPDITPAFHEEMIRLWYSDIQSILFMAFREGGKSTIAEEAFVLGAAFHLFNNGVILGADEDRAFDRMRAIKFEFETNEVLRGLYGELIGDVWNEGRIELANGVCIQAFGRGQKLRGLKHRHYRPDFCLADDIEEEEHVKDPIARHETLRWFFGVVMPAMDKKHRMRVTATPLDRDALPMTIQKQASWLTRVYPIEYLDANGERVPMWGSRYPLEWIDQKKSEMENLGLSTDYQREYMCVAEDPKQKVFTPDLIHVVPRTRVWQSTYAFYDPARSVKRRSASTGWVVFSFSGSKIIVWDGGAEMWKPDELRDHIFKIDEEFSPVAIGIEKDGLDEFLTQPLRTEMQRRNVFLPLIPMPAPKGKYAFIEALQPLMQSRELEFAQELPVLRAQFLSYPSGRIDGPNALAYAPRMRPGQVVYPGFSSANVVDTLRRRGNKFILAVNATRTITTAVLLQVLDGGIGVFCDYVRDGAPGDVLADILASARVDCAALGAPSSGLALFSPPGHFADFDTVGLRGAARKVPAELQRGAAEHVGRDEIRSLLAKTGKGGEPLLRVLAGGSLGGNVGARWVANGFASGYAHDIGRDGKPRGEPADGVYRTLLEGLESAAGLLRGEALADAGRPNVRYTASGQRYLSALPGQPVHGELKRSETQ